MVGPKFSERRPSPSTSSSYPNLIPNRITITEQQQESSASPSPPNGIHRKMGANHLIRKANGTVSHSSSTDCCVNLANFPTTAAPKWRPRLTMPALLPVLQQLRGNSSSSGFKSQKPPEVPPPIPPISTFLNRSQSVASRYQASPGLIKDLSLRSYSSYKT